MGVEAFLWSCNFWVALIHYCVSEEHEEGLNEERIMHQKMSDLYATDYSSSFSFHLLLSTARMEGSQMKEQTRNNKKQKKNKT
jgi:hypothetical protein